MEKKRLYSAYLVVLCLILFPKIVNIFYKQNSDMIYSIILTILILTVLAVVAVLIDTWGDCGRRRQHVVSRKQQKNNIILFIICFLGVAFLCGNSINDKILEFHLPKKVRLEVLEKNGEANSNIWIVNSSMQVLNFSDFEEIEENHFVSVKGTPILEVEVKKAAESNIILITNERSSNIKVMFDNHSQEYNCSSDVEQQKEMSLLYYDGLSLQRILEYIAVLVLISVVVWLFLRAGQSIVKKVLPQFYNFKIFQREIFQSRITIFVIVGILLSIYACMHYNMVQEYLETNTMGFDAGWYWYSADVFFLGEDRFTIDSFVNITAGVPFRGYFIPMFYGMIKWTFGKLLHINPLIITFILLSFIASFLNCILLPAIYSMFNRGEKVKIWQIVLINICFFVFLRGHVLWPLADLLPFVFVICALYFFLKYIYLKKDRILFWNFFFLMAAILCRQSYSILLYAELIWLIVWIRKYRMSWKVMLRIFLYVCAGIFVLGAPQIMVNFLRSHSLEYLGGSMSNYWKDQSLIERNIQFSVDTATQAWPFFLKDSLGLLMKNSIYPGMRELKLFDFAYIFISHPLEFVKRKLTNSNG